MENIQTINERTATLAASSQEIAAQNDLVLQNISEIAQQMEDVIHN